VTDVIYAGNICDVFMDAGGVPLRAQVTPADFERLAIGDGMVAAFDTRSMWPVPADDEVAAVDDESAGIDPTVPQRRIEVTA
jgi:hypothetical protein